METLTTELVSGLRAEIAILRHSHESLKEQNGRMREALEEWVEWYGAPANHPPKPFPELEKIFEKAKQALKTE